MKFLKIYIYWIICFLMPLNVDASHVWNVDQVPVPYLRDSCQYVSDPDHYVSQQQKDSANYYLQRLNLECGVQNLFVIVGKVENQDAFRMAQDLGNKYGIGYKKSRRGLVIVIAVEDHKSFIAPGMGLEGELTDVDCDDISRACIIPNMKDDKPGEAVVATSRAIYNKVKSGRTGIQSVDEGPVGDEDDWGLIIFFLLLCFGIPFFMLVRYLLQVTGVVKKTPGEQQRKKQRRHDDDDMFPPFFFGGGFGGGGGSFSSGSGFSGGSFGGGTFGGGGAGGSW